MRAIVTAFTWILAGAVAVAASGTAEEARIARQVRAHAEFLASDALRGRDTASPEYEIAARYVASRLASLGIEPAGENGTFFQSVPYRRTQIDPESAVVAFVAGDEAVELAWADDYLMSGDPGREITEVTAPAVFVGYGISAPGIGHDDYAGVDVEGKVAVLFGGAPASFPHDERAYYSSGRTKRVEAAARGAVGMLNVSTADRMERVPWERSKRHAGRPSLEWIAADGSIADYDPRLLGSATLSPPAASRLFELAGRSFEATQKDESDGRVESFELGVEVTLAARSAHADVTAPNVVGVLPGADPERAAEHVVYSAHLDHVGVGAPEGDDEIYNGLYDNAMGVAVMLEVARLFAESAESAEPPRRSILFLAVGGEERGLLGSDYFAHRPTVPVGSLVADVNLDMPLFLFPLTEVIAFGAEHSSLQEVVAAAAERVGWTLAPDPMPEEVLFIRSDQYSFVRRGVPSVFLVTGGNSADPAIDGFAVWREFLSTRYHTPSDEPGIAVHWPSAARFTRLNYWIGRGVADAPTRPTWNAGDFFAARFATGAD